MEEIAFGWLGLSWEGFYDSEPNEFWSRLKGWTDQQERKSRESWEQTRLQTWYIVSMLTDKLKNPSDLFDLPWDEKPESKSKSLTDIERAAIFDKWGKVAPGQGKRLDIDKAIKKLK